MSRARSAVSASTVTLRGWISSTPPPTKIRCSPPSGVWMRTSPAFSSVSSGAWRGAMPMSPSDAGTNTISAGPEKISPSALTTSTSMVFATLLPSPYCRPFAFSTASSIEPTM